METSVLDGSCCGYRRGRLRHPVQRLPLLWCGPSRTDVVAVCNTGRPAWRCSGRGEWPSIRPCARRGYLERSRPGKIRCPAAPLAVSHPELDDFCDDYTEVNSMPSAQCGKAHVVVDKLIHERVDAG
jgi:hypothetical protein